MMHKRKQTKEGGEKLAVAVVLDLHGHAAGS